MNAKKQPDAESFDAAELGAMMREMRENLGHELDAVARDLRIRLVYLEAIESGRLSDLPGNAYVSGFLRSYSDFLGLEGDEIVRRFKMAGVEISNQPQLHLPSPVEEGRLPTASILLVAAVIAAAAYGGWYYLSGTGKGPMETVANLPKELSGLVDGAKNQTAPSEVAKSPAAPEAASDTGSTGSQTPETATTEAAIAVQPSETPATPPASQASETPSETTVASAQPATEPAPAAEKLPMTAAAPVTAPATSTPAPALTPAQPTQPVVATPAQPAVAVTNTMAAETAPVVKPVVETPVAAPVVPAAPASPVVPAAPVSEPATTTPAPVAAPENTPAAESAVRTAAVAPTPRPDPAPGAPSNPASTETASRSSADTASSTDTASPADTTSSSDAPSSSDAQPGSSVGGVRIVVRATADSYVAVRTSDNQPLFSQLMRRGDSYEVPSGADLVLETGNAGGLRITVGGKRVPSLGPIGQIRRNIPLDAEKLLSGIN